MFYEDDVEENHNLPFGHGQDMPSQSTTRVNTGRAKLITWLPSNSVEHIRHSALPSEGHSALLLELPDREVYISFWPGKCSQWHAQRPSLCQKAVPHFHSKDMDDLVKTTREDMEELSLYHLNITRMSATFELLHDENMNALYDWRIYNNCSDLVLRLLEHGGLFKEDNMSRFKVNAWLLIIVPITFFCVMASSTIDTTIYFHGGAGYRLIDLTFPIVRNIRFRSDYLALCVQAYVRKFRWDVYLKLFNMYEYLWDLELNNIFLPLLTLIQFLKDQTEPAITFDSANFHNSFLLGVLEYAKSKFISSLINRALTGFLFATTSAYLSYIVLSHKSILPFTIKHEVAKNRAVYIGLGITIWGLTESTVREFMKYKGITFSRPILPMELVTQYIHLYLGKMLSTYQSLSLPLVLSVPLIAIALPLSIKVFYDTTITPTYVLTLARQNTNFLTLQDEQPDISNDQEAVIEVPEMTLTRRYHFFNTPLKIQTALVAGAAIMFGAACFFGLKNIEIEHKLRLCNQPK